ncbi:MAG: hypothetical protein LBB26_03190, partial [Puniceicoccales bacterium]|nr:hypothetical protein [Puniceicoccales bacterium]
QNPQTPLNISTSVGRASISVFQRQTYLIVKPMRDFFHRGKLFKWRIKIFITVSARYLEKVSFCALSGARTIDFAFPISSMRTVSKIVQKIIC